jgi:putative oxidoreductase
MREPPCPADTPGAAASGCGMSVATTTGMRALVPLGRVLFALIFVASIVGQFSSVEISEAAAHGVPLATILVPLAGVIALVGGVSVMLGYRARFGALLLVVFLVPVTLVMHKFWGLPDPQMAMLQKIQFMKNTSLIGACLLIMYHGSGPYSLDG